MRDSGCIPKEKLIEFGCELLVDVDLKEREAFGFLQRLRSELLVNYRVIIY